MCVSIYMSIYMVTVCTSIPVALVPLSVFKNLLQLMTILSKELEAKLSQA